MTTSAFQVWIRGNAVSIARGAPAATTVTGHRSAWSEKEKACSYIYIVEGSFGDIRVRDGSRRKIVAWVVAEIMPHEAGVRAWLARSMISPDDIDDLIQEAYCRLAALESIDHIRRPDGYFFQTVKNLILEQVRRVRVVRIEVAAEIDNHLRDERPSPEDEVGARSEMSRVQALVATLPDRCRRIFEMRKIEGLSQREIAIRLGVSESVVENEGARGLRLVLKTLRSEGENDTEKSLPLRSNQTRSS